MKDFEAIYVRDLDTPWRRELHTLLEHWIACLKTVAKDQLLDGNYTPFWYNERAQVRFWSDGRICLVEWFTVVLFKGKYDHDKALRSRVRGVNCLPRQHQKGMRIWTNHMG